MDRSPRISSRIDRSHLRSSHRQTTRIRIRQSQRRHRSPESDHYNERTTNGWARFDRQQSDSFDRKTRTIFTGRKASSSRKIPLIQLKRTAPEVISSGAGPTSVVVLRTTPQTKVEQYGISRIGWPICTFVLRAASSRQTLSTRSHVRWIRRELLRVLEHRRASRALSLQ